MRTARNSLPRAQNQDKKATSMTLFSVLAASRSVLPFGMPFYEQSLIGIVIGRGGGGTLYPMFRRPAQKPKLPWGRLGAWELFFIFVYIKPKSIFKIYFLLRF